MTEFDKPPRHKTTHQSGGADEISLAGMTPGDHATRHQSGGADEISLAGMTPGDHAARHQSGGADEIDATGLTGAGGTGIQGDGTAGRVIRTSYITIENGTGAATIKCTLTNRWNGNAIAQTDNIGKGATVGHFTLDAAGQVLLVAAAGITGNSLYAMGVNFANSTTTSVRHQITASAGGFRIVFFHPNTAALQDMTALVDGGSLTVDIFYITDA